MAAARIRWASSRATVSAADSIASAAAAPRSWWSRVRLRRVRQLYNEVNVFEKAHRLVDKHQQRAEAIADEIEPEQLRRLLYYLIDTVLERPAEPSLPVVPADLSMIAR